MLNIRSIITSNDIRSLPSQFHKVQALNQHHSISVSQACEALDVGRRRYYRWLDAINKGRSPQKNGRPFALNADQEESLIEKIKKGARNSQAMTKIEIYEEVWRSCLVSVLSCLVLSCHLTWRCAIRHPRSSTRICPLASLILFYDDIPNWNPKKAKKSPLKARIPALRNQWLLFSRPWATCVRSISINQHSSWTMTKRWCKWSTRRDTWLFLWERYLWDRVPARWIFILHWVWLFLRVEDITNRWLLCHKKNSQSKEGN